MLRSAVKARVERWFPLRHSDRRGLYESVATWPRNYETQAMLWRGLLDEEDWSQRTAAESLAKVFGGDPSVAERLFELLLRPAEPRLLASALHALNLGWQADPKLPTLLHEARCSADTSLQSVALIHRVKRNEHDAKDRDMLMALLRWLNLSSWCWKEERVRALVTGWPGDPEVKREAIQGVTGTHESGRNFEWNNAGSILLEGFPQDNEVAEAIAHLFQTEKYLGIPLGSSSRWRRLADAFGGHQIVGLAVDDLLERRMEEESNRLLWDFELCLVSRSARAKNCLLKIDDETGVITHYQAPWLLEGWGMQDEEAAAALTKFAASDVSKHAAYLLPDILPNTESCRQRLLEILRNESESVAGHALVGMIKLGANELDEEVIEAAVNMYSGKVPSGATFWGMRNFIAYFHHHPKVREVALYQLHNCSGDIDTVAKVYNSDDEIRCEIIESCTPIPAHLRATVVDRLSRLAHEDGFAQSLLSNYDEDIDANVKTTAAISYVNSVKRQSDVPSERLDQLNEGLRVIGPDYRKRRQAAFSALLELDRLDVVKSVWTEDPMKNIEFGRTIATNLCLAAHLTRHWERVSRAFGESFWDYMGRLPHDFFTEMVARPADSDLIDEILDKFEGYDQEKLNLPLLQLKARQWRGTSRLSELCLNFVRDFHISNWTKTAPGIVAAEILGEQFANDSEILPALESLVNEKRNHTALVVALSTGWSDSQAWERLQKRLSEQEKPRLMLPARICLLAASTPPNEFVVKVGETMAKLRGGIWEFLPLCSRAVTARFARDREVREHAFSRLETQPTISEKTNFPSFLLETNEQPERLRNWMRSEIERQSEGTRLAEFALDFSTGTVRSVSHVLLEHMMA